MESNEKYQVRCIVDNTQTEIKAMQEKDIIRAAIPIIRDTLEKFAIERATKQEVQHQEQKIIQDYTVTGQITPQEINTAIKKLQAAATMSRQRQQALVIANAATAAAIRKQFSREEVEVIISQAVETTTAYVVTDETLKQQLLQSIDKRGY